MIDAPFMDSQDERLLGDRTACSGVEILVGEKYIQPSFLLTLDKVNRCFRKYFRKYTSCFLVPI